jgi:hypothetical protein
MATADEPVDTDAIANQAASELRQQIEASPIGERLDRVVQEDRPLASRVASAETPLVPEPDDSPSAREVSFRLAEPTGRGAVRSALRTPGIAADLRPASPFGEDETGIAPEPEAVAKPEAADVDILEPEQPDRSPAGPDRDATAQGESTDELQELHKAQRHDRRARIGAGVLRGVQALASMIGGAANIPGLSALGGLSGVASGVIPQGAGVADFEQRHGLAKEAAQARQRAEQQAYERARNEAADALADRRVKAYEDAVAASAANTQIRESREDRAARTAAEKADEERRVAEADRGGALQQLANAMSRHAAATGTEIEGDAFAAARARVGDAPASAIRELADQYDAYTRDAERTNPRRSGGGGGGGGASAQNIATMRQQLIAAGGNEANINALPPKEVRRMVARLEQDRMERAARNGGTGDGQPQVDQRQYAQYEAQRRPLYVREASLLRLQGTLNQLRQNNPATFAAALTDSRAFNNASSEAAVVRSQINRAVAAYLNKISGAGVSEGEFERTMRNTGAHNVINPQVLFSFIGDELSNTRDSRDSLATRGGGAFEREFARQLAAQRAARQPQGGRQ